MDNVNTTQPWQRVSLRGLANCHVSYMIHTHTGTHSSLLNSDISGIDSQTQRSNSPLNPDYGFSLYSHFFVRLKKQLDHMTLWINTESEANHP